MKHRHVGLNNARLLNTDGHAIGLDIGATSVRASVLTPGTTDGRPSVTIAGSGRMELPSGAVVNGVVQEPAIVTAAIKELWATNKFECKNVILGIANQQVTVRELSIPDLEPDQRARALPFQARDIVALPIEQVILDFATLGAPDPTTGLMPGLLVAAPREPVLTAVNAVEKAGLKVCRVDLASFACLRAIADEHRSVEAVIDLGAHLTTIVIHNQGVPRLVRTLTRGGDELTAQIADNLGIPVPKAEQLKCEQGLQPGSETFRALVDAVRPLLAEIRTSIGYFRSMNDSPIERISLTGGGSHLPGIVDAVTTQMGLPVRVVDPMQHVRNKQTAVKTAGTSDAAHRPTAVSIGLAIGAAA